MSNKVILQQMIRLSGIIKSSREARTSLNSMLSQVSVLLISGNTYNSISRKIKEDITNCLYIEQCLRLSVSNACKCLDGFNEKIMEPIDYISSSDVKNKFVDLCLGKSIVATIDLTTGKIIKVEEPEQNNG